MTDSNRNQTVAGKFYPMDRGELDALISNLLDSSKKVEIPNTKIKALIVPFSGYTYSGQVQAAGYNQLDSNSYDEIFIITESHFHDVDKLAFSNYRTWETPLGGIEQSHRIESIVASDDSKRKDLCVYDNKAHEYEHTVEVQLPFIQKVNPDTRIIPVILGKTSPRLAANSISANIDSNDLVIVPAELSFNYPQDYAEEIDKVSIQKILELDLDAISSKQFDVKTKNAISFVCELANTNNWKPFLIKYMNSSEVTDEIGDTTGYVAIGFHE